AKSRLPLPIGPCAFRKAKPSGYAQTERLHHRRSTHGGHMLVSVRLIRDTALESRDSGPFPTGIGESAVPAAAMALRWAPSNGRRRRVRGTAPLRGTPPPPFGA